MHDGIAQMFKVIEYARMMVGTKAIATLSTGYLNALEYAKTRVQGADLTQMTDKTAPRVTITHHPDVRRSLMLQKAYAEGMRALIAYTAYWQDLIEMAEAGDAEVDHDMAERMNDLLLPIVKGVGSERSYELLAVALQTLRRLRASCRTTRSSSTSATPRSTPCTRAPRRSRAWTSSSGRWSATSSSRSSTWQRRSPRRSRVTRAPAQLAAERELLGRALEDVQAIVGVLGQWAMASQQDAREIYKVGLNTTRLLMATGDLVVGWLLLRQAEVATKVLAGEVPERERVFYAGKIETAKWFARNRLPLLAAERAVAEATTLDLMDLPEEAF